LSAVKCTFGSVCFWARSCAGCPIDTTTCLILVTCRFHDNYLVQDGPKLRFYCGTPLIGSNGHRLGTLCFCDSDPRRMDAQNCVILQNMAGAAAGRWGCGAPGSRG
jgi:hypothetical protein